MTTTTVRVTPGTCAHALLTTLAAEEAGTFAGTVADLAAVAWPTAPGSAPRVVRRLEVAGLVSIDRENPQRARAITATPEGLAELVAGTPQLVAEVVAEAEMGRIERKTRADIEAMVSEHPMGEALAEGVLAAARVLDRDVEAKSYAGIMREWRAGLMELAKYAAAGADELDDELSAPSEGEGG